MLTQLFHFDIFVVLIETVLKLSFSKNSKKKMEKLEEKAYKNKFSVYEL